MKSSTSRSLVVAELDLKNRCLGEKIEFDSTVDFEYFLGHCKDYASGKIRRKEFVIKAKDDTDYYVVLQVDGQPVTGAQTQVKEFFSNSHHKRRKHSEQTQVKMHMTVKEWQEKVKRQASIARLLRKINLRYKNLCDADRHNSPSFRELQKLIRCDDE